MIQQLRNVLWEVQAAAGNDFSGLGLLICDAPETLPIVSLRLSSSPPSEGDLVASLAKISNPASEYHDGFHIVSSKWKLSLVSQYFSPRIVPGAIIDRRKVFGGRYMAALFGSAIPSVELTGIVSRPFGIAIFENGAERYFEGAP